MMGAEGRVCDGCGQKIPAGAKLGQEIVTADEARAYESSAPANPDGSVTIDLCLMCRIRRGERLR
jgi:hypothetical protein